MSEKVEFLTVIHMAIIVDMVRLSRTQEEVRTRFQLNQEEAATGYGNVSTDNL